MRTIVLTTCLVVALTLMPSGVALARGGHEEVPLSKLPDSVVLAVKEAVPGIQITDALAFFACTGDLTGYEIFGADVRGRPVLIYSDPVGDVSRVETTVTMADVPPEVRKTFEWISTWNSCKIQRIERTSRPGEADRFTFLETDPEIRGLQRGLLVVVAKGSVNVAARAGRDARDGL